jgi:hypothetical protein
MQHRALLRQVASLSERWHFFYDGQNDDIMWIPFHLIFSYNFRYIADTTTKDHVAVIDGITSF